MNLKNDLAEFIVLDGAWKFSLGDASVWGEIQVPGCWEAQGYSKLVDGPATYRREVTIPDEWAGQTIIAQFEAVSYACTILLNGVKVGSHRGLWTPFEVDLTPAVRQGEKNLLELIVYKPGEHYPMRSSLAGFIPDVSTTFGGIWQPVRLMALHAGLDDFWIKEDVATRLLQIHCKAVPFGIPLAQAEWLIEVFEAKDGVQDHCLVSSQRLSASQEGTPLLDASLVIPGAKLWDPTCPALYTVQVSLFEADKLLACTSKKTGFRKLSAKGSQLQLNGQPCILRGILSWGWEPDQIAPAYSPEQVRAEICRVRVLGFNLIKLCLFVPNQVYFDIADEEGMLLWLEFPMWLPEVSEELRAFAPAEYADITYLAHHHPSVVLYSLGCELSQSVDGELMGSLNQAVRGGVSNVLVCDNSGSGESYGGLEFDFADFTDYHPYYDLHYFGPLLDHWRRDWQPPRPWIFGEFCDSDTFRDLDGVIKANGGSRPWWLTEDNPVTRWRPESRAMLEAEQRMEQAQALGDGNIAFTAQELVKISYAQSLVVRKYTLELIRCRAGIGGYIVTGLRDTPISTSGIWDDFARPKWSAEEFLPINAEAVLCLDSGRRRRWQYGGDRPERLDLFNLWSGEKGHWYVILSLTGSQWPAGAELTWTLSDRSGTQLASGSSRAGKNQRSSSRQAEPRQVGAITCQMPDVQQAVELCLRVVLTNNKLRVENQWPVWVYPALPEPPPSLGIIDPAGCYDDCGDWLKAVRRIQVGDKLASFHVILSTTWDSQLEEFVENGGSVLLLQQGNSPLPARRCPFWREAIKLFMDHPVWSEGKFPQRGFTDMQFFGLASDVAFDSPRMSQFLPEGTEIHPILRRLDGREFQMSEYVFEATIGRGILLACALRLQGGVGAQPFGWQRNVAGGALLSTFLNYLIEKG